MFFSKQKKQFLFLFYLFVVSHKEIMYICIRIFYHIQIIVFFLFKHLNK